MAFLAKERLQLLPMVQLIEQAPVAVEEVIDLMGRATLEGVLMMSAERVARFRPDPASACCGDSMRDSKCPWTATGW